VLKEWSAGQSLEAVLFNRRVGMTHDVTYDDLYWEPVGRQVVIRERFEHERDRSSTWGMHVEYARPLGDSGWRAGVVVTGNRVDNPSRPAYEIETIPGAHGRSSAFNVGVGVARSLGATTLGADAIYEPIWSRMWSVSDSVIGATGGTFQPGRKTVDSRLRFSNAVLRTGVSHDLTLTTDSKLQLLLGAQARAIYYTVDQRDPRNASRRVGDESWMEWTQSWGATLKRTSLEFHYRGRRMTGAGRPGISPGVGPDPIPLGIRSSATRPVLSPAPMTLRDVSVTTHQLWVSLRLR
jgi:hypothetical protein